MSNEFSEMTQELEELVRAHGDKVSIHTEECVLWKLEHPNCAGCPSELGCGKVAKLILNKMRLMAYQLKPPEDFTKMHQYINELNDRILKAEVVEGLRVIPNC